MDPEQTVQALVALCQDAPTPLAGALLAGEIQKLMRDATSKLAELRRAFVRAMAAEGWEQEEIGEALGITKARIGQILDA